MDGQLTLYQKGVPVGTITRREEGLHSVFVARCKGGDGLRKVWLYGEGGGKLLVGTLIPDGDGWRTGCRVVRSSLERQGLTGKLWGESVPAEESGTSTPSKKEPPVSPEDPVLRRLYTGEYRGRWMRGENGWQVAFDWQIGQPVPWLPLICFARPGQGGLYFLLDEKGYPLRS